MAGELARTLVALTVVAAVVGGLVSLYVSNKSDHAGHANGHDNRARTSPSENEEDVGKITVPRSKANQEIRLEGPGWTVVNSNGSISVPGTVPGSMYSALETAAVIGDPYYRFNDNAYRWVHWDNWTYSTTFDVTQEFLGQQAAIRLACESLDTVADLYVNDQLIGSSQNQFVRYVYDITNTVQLGTNTLRVAFTSAPQYAKNAFDNHPYRIPPECPPPDYNGECHANMIRKAACSFSWDWGPSFATQGINGGIWVESIDVVKIRDIMPQLSRGSATEDWNLNATICVDVAGQQFQGDVTVEFPEVSLSFTATDVTITPDPQDGNLGKISMANLVIPQGTVEDWWPRGYGGQTMYDMTVTMVDGTATTVDTKTIKTAFRTVETVEDVLTTGLTFYFKINDVPIYMKGSNWIPVDSFLERVTPERLRRLLESAVYTNMNTIRIWGGGVYEKVDFYDKADELGLLIWQDLMFACNMYPVDDPFLNNVRDEMKYQIRRLSRHPSVIAWTANNENEGALVDNWYGTDGPLYPRYKTDYVELYIDTMMNTILTYDTTRPFLPSSPTNAQVTEDNGWISEDPRPSSPDYGDIHFYNYVDDCLDHNLYLPTRYSSEYGYQSWPSVHTLAKVSQASDLFYNSDFAKHRQHHPGAGNGTEQNLRRHFTWPDSGDPLADFPKFVYLTQATQAMCYKVQSEKYRRAQSDPDMRTMGALYWQHNDIWQAPTWATIDVNGYWKMAHYYAAHFFADPMVSTIEDNGVLSMYTVTDSTQSISGVNLVIRLWNWGSQLGTPTYTWTIPTSVPAASATLAYSRPTSELLSEGGCQQRAECLLTLHLEDSGSQIISPVNPYYLVSWKDAVGMIKPAIQITDVAEVTPREFTITLTSNNIAAFVWLEAPDIPGRFSDNGFLWTDSTVHTMTFHAWEDVLLGDLIAALEVTSLADIY